MTMSEPAPAPAKQPGALARAELAARRLVLMMGVGLVAYVAGSMLSTVVLLRVADVVTGVRSDAVAFGTVVAIRSAWVLLLLPPLGYLLGRVTGVDALRFTTAAVFTGEVFDVLLRTAMQGFEPMFTTEELVGRAATIVLGGGLTLLATSLGSRSLSLKGAAAAPAPTAEQQAFAQRSVDRKE